MFHVPGNLHFGGCSQQLLKFTQARIFRSRPSFFGIKNTFVLRLHCSGYRTPTISHAFSNNMQSETPRSRTIRHPIFSPERGSHAREKKEKSSSKTFYWVISTGIQPSPSFGSCTISTFAVVRNTGALFVVCFSFSACGSGCARPIPGPSSL